LIITVSQTMQFEPSVEAVMDVLDGFENLIHGAFVEMTEPP